MRPGIVKNISNLRLKNVGEQKITKPNFELTKKVKHKFLMNKNV